MWQQVTACTCCNNAMCYCRTSLAALEDNVVVLAVPGRLQVSLFQPCLRKLVLLWCKLVKWCCWCSFSHMHPSTLLVLASINMEEVSRDPTYHISRLGTRCVTVGLRVFHWLLRITMQEMPCKLMQYSMSRGRVQDKLAAHLPRVI